MAVIENYVRIVGIVEVVNVTIRPHETDKGIIVLEGQDGDAVWMDREGATLAANFLMTWAAGNKGDPK